MSFGSGQDLSEFSMMDLFRSEVESHTEILSEGLLSLEEDPGSLDNIESLMRAAHSIKGGARIVELEAAVKIAHSMEDCFVAAQKGEVRIDSDHIDTLLQGVDMLSQIASVSDDNMDGWITGHQSNIDKIYDSIVAIIKSPQQSPPKSTRKPAAAPKTDLLPPEKEKSAPPPDDADQPDEYDQPDEEAPKVTPAITGMETGQSISQVISTPALFSGSVLADFQPAVMDDMPACALNGTEKQADKNSEKERILRVKADKIERLMGLAGEVVVSARWLPPFYDSLHKLKKKHSEISGALEKILDMVQQDPLALRKKIQKSMETAKICNQDLLDCMKRLDSFTSTSETLSDRLYHEIISVRMCPFSDGIRGFPRMVRDLARELGKKVKLVIIGESTEVDRDIMERLESPLSHILRNAVDHGIESPEERIAAGKPEVGEIRMEAAHRSGMLTITVSDDGRGIRLDFLREKVLAKVLTSSEMVEKLSDAELLDFLFLPGFSTVENVTELSGRGVGLDVVHNMVHEVGGVVRAMSNQGKGLSFHLELPLTLSVIRTFLVQITDEPYAFPLARIDSCLKLPRSQIEMVEDREYFRVADSNVSLVDLHDILRLKNPSLEHEKHEHDQLHVVVVGDRKHSYGLVVDKFLGECELVVRPLDRRLGKVPNIAAAAIMLDGNPVLIFDIDDLVRSIDNVLMGKQKLHKITGALENIQKKNRKRVLVVDDSITVREMERKILENNGYRVDVAVDGMDGWNLLRTGEYDMVVSDIDMPRMNGIELINLIKQHERYKTIPVVVVSYKNKEEDRLRGLEAGANYYLTKTSFQDNSFINAVVDLIGKA